MDNEAVSVKLDILAVELIQRIAGFLPCESALTCLLVNKSLYDACYDALVFKSIIENGNGREGEPSEDTWLPDLPSNAPAETWARWALADSRVYQLRNESGKGWREILEENEKKFNNFGCWFPQLVAAKHPAVTFASPYKLTGSADLAQVSELSILGFCLSAQALTHQTSQLISELVAIQTMLRQLIKAAPSKTNRRPTSIVVVGVLHADILQAIEKGHIGTRNPDPDYPHLRPPSMIRIPFGEFMDLPRPFSVETTRAFETAHFSTHLSKMTSVEFLEEGEWGGYYCYSFNPHHAARFDRAMRGIRFKAMSAVDGRTLRLFASGTDGPGHFNLVGKLSRETGEIIMQKQYTAQNTTYLWTAVMAPFGIVGTWDVSTGMLLGGAGWFWLWKIGWSGDFLA